MTLVLTPSQERTLDLSTHLSVTANAGAGKTSVLARRFVEIFLRTDTRLSGVVAITFTEQAAGELRKKIHGVILEMERDPGLRAEQRRRLAAVRTHLSSAQIGTIHSFCARVLRLYPAEADVDASFSVIEGQDRARLIGESIAETFADAMGRPGGAGPGGEFRDLLRAVPPRKLERFLQRMFSRREQLFRLHAREAEPGGVQRAGSAPPAAGGWNGRIVPAICALAAGSDWRGRARETALAAAGKGAATLLGLLDAAEAAPDAASEAALIVGAGDEMFTLKGEFRKSFLGATPPDELPQGPARYLADFERRYGRVLRSMAAEGAAERDSRYERLAGALDRVFRSAEERYDAKKEEIGALDFEDLQIRTLGLLSRDDVGGRLRAEYRYILVDEFQDTNDLQYSLIRGLLGDFRQGNLFIVGDPKQSIYGFRNAEVEVFYDARSDIAAAVARGGDGAGDAGGGSLVLEESFRPLPEIAAFVNVLFSGLMRRGGSLHEVDYNRMVVGRRDTASGAVELLLTPPEPDGPFLAGQVVAECSLIARRLREVEAGGTYAFGQCAVLLRDRTNLPALEKAFEEAGVPYLLAGGVGFFQTQEIYDFLNYLRVLLTPEDDVALAGILRSPFFGLSDADLYNLSVAEGESLWGKLTGAAAVAQAAAGRAAETLVRRAAGLLAAHRALADRIPVPRLLRRIAADTGWIGAMAGLSHGPQHRENFLKLLDLARDRGAGAPPTLYDFCVYLDHRAEEEVREGQAATAPSGKAVRVMTVHAAKGLEFPLVVLPFLDRRSGSDQEPLIHPGFGIGFSPLGERDGKEGPAPLHAFLKALAEERGIAEEKRVFYVACTRARDVLMLSGGDNPKTPGNTPLGWLKSVLAARGIREVGSAFDFGSVPLSFLDPGVKEGAQATREIPLMMRVIRPVAPGAGGPPAAGGCDALSPVRVLTSRLADTRGGETYSATRLKTFLECPVRYYLSYVLGLASGTVAPRGDDDGAADRDGPDIAAGQAGLEGEITHELLSAIAPGDPEGEIGARIGPLVRARCSDPAAAVIEARVLENVSGFLRSDEGRRILSRPGAKCEYQISALVGDAVVTGKIDRLFAGGDGSMEFVDYKTDQVSPAVLQHKGEEHRPQVSIYAYLIGRLTGQTTVRGTLAFLKLPSAPVRFTFHEDDFRAVEQSLLDSIATIRRGVFTPPPEPCQGCPNADGRSCGVLPPVSLG